jgi:hypothetical protein
MESLEMLCEPCKDSCCLAKTCTKFVPLQALYSVREQYFGSAYKPAPSDKDRAKMILELLKKTKRATNGELIFYVGESYKVCTAGYLRSLGVLTDADESKAPGQWKRLIKGYKNGITDVNLLSKDDLKMDYEERATNLMMHATSFITHVSQFYSDMLPAVTSENSNTKIRQVPYRTVKDLWCQAFIAKLSDSRSQAKHRIRHFSEHGIRCFQMRSSNF